MVQLTNRTEFDVLYMNHHRRVSATNQRAWMQPRNASQRPAQPSLATRLLKSLAPTRLRPAAGAR
jgi:hypothetical protein